MSVLAEKLDPKEVSRQLYAIAVISESNRERAIDENIPKTERAKELVLFIIRKLRSQPEWFEDICTVLSKAGVTTIEEAKSMLLHGHPLRVLFTILLKFYQNYCGV